MIDKLVNISKKSFHNFSFDENLRKCNIFLEQMGVVNRHYQTGFQKIMSQ
ncbi:hypothetical protein HMPREF0850_01368 [Streptococcus sp. M143]|nr:hypothetical protein HMPREF0850_01368 [Streptococcus sp. M143]